MTAHHMMVDLPPYAATMGITQIVDAHVGDEPVLAMAFHDGLAGRPGMLHGGAIAGLIDMAAYTALKFSLIANGASQHFKPIGITIDYVRGGKLATTFARGKVTRIGRRVATVFVEAWQDDSQKHIAAARIHMLLSPEPD